MTTYRELKKLHLTKQITEEEYQKRKAEYLDRIIDLYLKGHVSKKQVDKFINE